MYPSYIRALIGKLSIGVITFILLLSAFGFYTLIDWAVGRNYDSYYKTVGLEKPWSVKERERQLTCLAQNIYWEAGNEPFEGKVAVAQVTINRMVSGKFPNDICRVVQQRTQIMDKIVCQFSWYCEREKAKSIKPVHQDTYVESEEVAKKVLLEGFRLDGIKDALYYHATYVNPKWGKEKVAKIGQHVFYKD